jgi:hypothetical protein
MHEPSAEKSISTKTLTQADADRCCASSESQGSASQSPQFALVAPTATPAFELFAATPESSSRLVTAQDQVPLPSPIPKHLLLSVYLI